jgi:hypothetical protein
MIKLFRNIRKTLLIEGKTAHYLKYAIGEIVLVVIGILIALQINNWNEQRKERIQEIRQLKNIQEDIILDKKDVLWNIEAHKLFSTSEKELLNYMISEDLKPKKPIAYESALGIPIILTLHESSFSNLRNNDINIITNEKLKKQIASYFDNFAKVILRIENDLEDYKTYSVIKPYFLKYFKYANKSSIVGNFESVSDDYFSPTLEFNKYILADTLGLKKDEAFKVILAESISLTSNKLDIYEDFLKRIFELNKAINEELKKIE